MTDTKTNNQERTQTRDQELAKQQANCPHLVTDRFGRCENCYKFIGEGK